MKIDNVSLERIKLMHPAVRDEVEEMFREMTTVLTGRAMIRLAYTLRTYAEQDALYAQGRHGNKGKIVTNAKGGQSFHNFGLAFDIVLLIDRDNNGTYESASWETNVDLDSDGKADWQEVVSIAKQFGWTWGGEWKFSDMPHFEKTFGLSVRELDFRVRNKKVIKDTNYPQL